MKINVDYFDNELIFSNDKILVLEIENKKYFYRFVNELYAMSNSNSNESIKFFDEELKELNFNNKIKVFINFFDFNFESKKYNNEILKYICNNITEETKENICKSYSKVINIYNKIVKNLDIPLVVLEDVEVEQITKNMKIIIETETDLLNNLLLLIDLEKELKSNNILFFINLKQYLTPVELQEMYKYSLYNDVKIVLIDSQSYGGRINYEKKFIIDNNLEEFMLE